MSVITVSREAGSGGTAIAEGVAKSLGYQLVDKQTIGALLEKYGLISFSKVYDNAPAFWDAFDAQETEDRDTVLAMMNKAILAIAKRGNVVIVGRGGYVVLGGYSDVLNVRVQAPLALRIRNMQAQLKNADFGVVEKDVKNKDRIRSRFMETAYSMKVEPVTAFDLVINTEKIGADNAVALIAEAARGLDRSSVAGERPVSKTEIDPVLAEAVGQALGH